MSERDSASEPAREADSRHALPPWSHAATQVWGKSDRDDEMRWLPLVQHLWDAMEVAGRLWDEWVPLNVQAQIEAALPEGARDGRTLVRWLAGIHDVGKASPAFSIQVPHLAEQMRRCGAALPTDVKERSLVPHATAGEIAVQEWLEQRYGADLAAAKALAAPVGAHHGRAPTASALQAARPLTHLLGTGLWHDTRTEILNRMQLSSGANQHLAAWAAHPVSVRAQMLATAVVILADWIASDETRFGYRADVTEDVRRVDAAWTSLDLPPRWAATEVDSDVDALLGDRFPMLAGKVARPVQRVAVELARATTGPSLLLVEAPMGVGKTEAALLAAEELAHRHGLSGVFVGLPTMATSDAMFSRVLDWVDRLPGDGAVSTFLAHSKAALNDTWDGLVSEAREHDRGIVGVHDDDAWSDLVPGDAPGRAEAVAVSWLSGRKKGALASFVVGTVDQALFAALHAKHLMLRHLAMAGKVVVIDEVHAADDYMRTYLRRALEWFAAYDVPVVLLSATLPSAQRAELGAAYARGLGQRDLVLPPTAAYPVLTSVDTRGVTITAPPTESTGPAETTVAFEVVDDGPDAIVDLLRHQLREGGCAAVVQNTVGRAQAAYEALAAAMGDDVVLVHSRLLAPERARREAELRARLGPAAAGGVRPERLVVVGTQVLEQSLDVDFDVMVTDLAPVDLVLQRVGRLHRHERLNRPSPLTHPRCYLTGILAWGDQGGPELDGGSEAVYGRSRLLRSCVALELEGEARRSVRLPSDIRPLVERAYADDPEPPAQWRSDLAKSDAVHQELLAAAAGRAETYLLRREPRRGATLGDLLHLPLEATEDRAGGASVRDGDGSLDVLLVTRAGDEVRLLPGDFPGAGQVLPVELEPPGRHLAKAAAACTLRLPHAMCTPWKVDAVIRELEAHGFASWQRSPWLAGQLVLCLDESLRARVLDFHLTYDLDLGLLMSREGSRT